MKTFRFKGERQYIEYFTVDINAETLEEAQEIIDDGEYEESDHNHDFVYGTDEIEFDHIVGE